MTEPEAVLKKLPNKNKKKKSKISSDMRSDPGLKNM